MELFLTLCFSTFQHNRKGDPENVRRQGGNNFSGSIIPKPTLVSYDDSTDQRGQLYTSKARTHTVSSWAGEEAQTQENEVGGISYIRKCLVSAGLSEKVADIIMQSWRTSTRKQYGSYFQRWVQFCNQQQINKIDPYLGEIISFLTLLHDDWLGYSAINTAKSMLSAIFEIMHKRDIGKEILIKSFMKGIFHLRRTIPKTNFTWNVKKVLKWFETLNNQQLTLRPLSIKLAVLLALTTGQRCQTLSLMDLTNMEISPNSVKIRIGELIKQSMPQYHLPELFIEAFNENKSICVIDTLMQYILKTKDKRMDTKLFIITQKPFSTATKSTIARWIKLGLKLAGIDINMFTPHSTRGASTSALVNKVPIDTIIKTAGWTKECTFRKFYRRPVTNDSSFSSSILQIEHTAQT